MVIFHSYVSLPEGIYLDDVDVSALVFLYFSMILCSKILTEKAKIFRWP